MFDFHCKYRNNKNETLKKSIQSDLFLFLTQLTNPKF